jgi:hypothetical protein
MKIEELPMRVQRVLKLYDRGVVDEDEAKYQIGLVYKDDGCSGDEAEQLANEAMEAK